MTYKTLKIAKTFVNQIFIAVIKNIIEALLLNY